MIPHRGIRIMSNSDNDKRVTRSMPIERGPPIVNDFKAWVGRKVKRSSDD